MNKVSLSAINANDGTPTFALVPYSPDNSQNARRFMAALASAFSGDADLQVEFSEMTAPSESKGGPAKAVCRVRVSLPQLKLVSGVAGSSYGSLAFTGQNEFAQAALTLTVPALWSKVVLGAVPTSDSLRLQVVALIRGAICDCVNGVLGDLRPAAAFDAAAWTTLPAPTSPLYRALQGANPEDVFNGSYGDAT